ncbi:MAG: DUF2075 domain-containing protein [Phycisphaerae bacterium]
MQREYYSNSIVEFIRTKSTEILGELSKNNEFPTESTQKDAWLEEIEILKRVLAPYQGKVYLEYSIPRMGKRIDAVVLTGPVIFVLEFKIGEKDFLAHGLDQVWDYALDLKNFHETSHESFIAPVLIASKARLQAVGVVATPENDKLLLPIKSNTEMLGGVIEAVLRFADGEKIDPNVWDQGRYCPTPTIVEAAMALYRGHSVAEISRSDASATNLSQTSETVSEIINLSQANKHKSICFVTGVPGAGKTLVGLNIATKHIDKNNDLYSVFLSGNGPLVAILREALTRDKVRREKALQPIDKTQRRKVTKSAVMSEVKMFIQNVHNFRDECLKDRARPPLEHVALFDEAQRAWNLAQTSSFMLRKKQTPNFKMSEPEFLISCLDRHQDWAVVVCLVGGGQEINTGEAGITEWIEALNRSFPDWRIYISSRLSDSEYGAGNVLEQIRARQNVVVEDNLHLAVSMRSFRAEHVSALVKKILDLEVDEARRIYQQVQDKYPIVITRDLAKAKGWLQHKARGSERYGIVVSSQAQRLKPYAIDVKSPMDPIHWFLDDKQDVRSSYYLEDVATEFHVQGLELDWACVTWDADFRRTADGWGHYSFCGDRWNNTKKTERKMYLKNAYRVLLTRARQGMVIVVPDADPEDPTRKREYYDHTYDYLAGIGFTVL